MYSMGMLTPKGKEALAQLERLDSEKAKAKKAQEEAEAKKWAESQSAEILRELQTGSLDNSILLMSIDRKGLKTEEKRKIQLLGKEFGIPLADHIRTINMGGGDPRERDDWYVCIEARKLLNLLRDCASKSDLSES